MTDWCFAIQSIIFNLPFGPYLRDLFSSSQRDTERIGLDMVVPDHTIGQQGRDFIGGVGGIDGGRQPRADLFGLAYHLHKPSDRKPNVPAQIAYEKLSPRFQHAD